MRTLRYGLLGLLALVAVPRVVCAQDNKPTVAVLPMTAFAVGRPDVKDAGANFTDMLTTELAAKPNIRLIDRAQIEDMITKQKLLLSGRVSEEAAMRAGKLLGAQYIVVGQITLAQGDARMDVRLVDSETGVTLRAVKDRRKETDLLDVVEKIADEFTRDLKVPVIAHKEAVRIPVLAVLNYSRGLDFEKRGKKLQAAQMYEKTLQISPNYEDAQEALARVK